MDDLRWVEGITPTSQAWAYHDERWGAEEDDVEDDEEEGEEMSGLTLEQLGGMYLIALARSVRTSGVSECVCFEPSDDLIAAARPRSKRYGIDMVIEEDGFLWFVPGAKEGADEDERRD